VGGPAYGGFQLYTVAKEITVAAIPESLPYEQAVVLPLSISTAAAGLYQKGFLEVPYPTIDPKPTGKTILTIQFAVASGLTVVSTASKKNLEYVKALGAHHVFDYSSATVDQDIIATLKGSTFVGAFDAISLPESLKPTAEIVHQLGGGKIATVLGAPSEGLPSDVTTVGGEIPCFPLMNKRC
jgi:NADPH:quinone reductase-like Zn-dependent oxidoreductase